VINVDNVFIPSVLSSTLTHKYIYHEAATCIK
jgi:hypothetical protein